MDEVIAARIRGDIDMSHPTSPFMLLSKARNKVYAKSTLTLQALRMHVMFLKFEMPIGGRFPKEVYVRLITRMQNIFNFMTMVIMASEAFADLCCLDSPDEIPSNQATWSRDFRRLLRDANATNREITSLLAMLSAGVTSGNPLPPYMKAPPPYGLVKKMDAMDRSILSIRHISEPEFAAFACIQIGTKCINDDVTALLRDVKQLVGELDFSFHTVNVSESGSNVDSDSAAFKDGKND